MGVTQLARVPAFQAGCSGFESLYPHQSKEIVLKFVFREAKINKDMSGETIEIKSEQEALDAITENAPQMDSLQIGQVQNKQAPVLWILSEHQRGVVGWIIH